MTGADLKQARLSAGLTQQQLADQAGFHRLAVGYWENKQGEFSAMHGAPHAFAKALGMKYFSAPVRARVMGSYSKPYSIGYKTCGAITRKGTPCRMNAILGKGRCKYHGGLSTGPTTKDGRARIAEAQRNRWRNFRQSADKHKVGMEN